MELTKLKKEWESYSSEYKVSANKDGEQEYWRFQKVEDYFESGIKVIDLTYDFINILPKNIKFGTALDFGCGLGRYSQALSKDFNKVYGIDISDRMINGANRHNKYKDKCIYKLNSENNLNIFNDNTFDFIFTSAVLQHLPIKLALKYLKEFSRIIKPGGIIRVDFNQKINIKIQRNKFGRFLNKIKFYILKSKIKKLYNRLLKKRYMANEPMHSVSNKRLYKEILKNNLNIIAAEKVVNKLNNNITNVRHIFYLIK